MNEYLIYHDRPGLEVVFNNGVEDLSLYYVVYEWEPATKFYNLITKAIEENIGFRSHTSFNITEDDENNLLGEINKSIDAINLKYNLSIQKIDKDSDFNDLHRDLVPVKCELWTKINDNIHAYEQYSRMPTTVEPRINAYFKFLTEECIPLEPEDFLFFRTDRSFGDLCLNYTYRGKHWLELESDNDVASIDDGQLQPEDRILPDAYMIFRPPSPSPFYRLNKFVSWFKTACPDRTFSLDMAVGYLLVGKLIMPASWDQFYNAERNQWTRLLSNYKNIVDVKLMHYTVDMIPDLLIKSRMPR